MIYLKDTCIFIKDLDSLNIMKIIDKYKLTEDEFGITDIILDELKPGKAVEKEDAEKSKSMLTMLQIQDKSGKINKFKVKEDNPYKQNFNNIRKRYYGHLENLNYIKHALNSGEITQEQFKSRSYKYKDYGECSCIAVAMEHPNDVTIVSRDKGRIFMKDDINLFEEYKKECKIRVIEFDEWKEELDNKVHLEKNG